eukprot:4207691-Amphidinium_carterae.1
MRWVSDPDWGGAATSLLERFASTKHRSYMLVKHHQRTFRAGTFQTTCEGCTHLENLGRLTPSKKDS